MARTTTPAPAPEDDINAGEALLNEEFITAEEFASESVEETPEPASSILVDEFHGQGGLYLLDPETGVRTLVRRTLPPTPPER